MLQQHKQFVPHPVSGCKLQAASGRNFGGQRFGPRPLDLDIIFYNSQKVQSDRLCIPHPRWQERDFVIAPLADLFSHEEEEGLMQGSWQGLAGNLIAVRRLWRARAGAALVLHWLHAIGLKLAVSSGIGHGAKSMLTFVHAGFGSSVKC